MFRLLRADEIETRVSTCTDKGVTLLLYKDARADMNILDETVGAFGWKREHTRDNANCTVSIWDDVKKQWIAKEDTGTESNTEKEKGLASDSFKRACFNWGIGRELYTAPFIYISADKVKIEPKNGKASTYDKFEVSAIGYDEHKSINMLVVVNSKTKAEVYTIGKKTSAPKPQPPKETPPLPTQTYITPDQAVHVANECADTESDIKEVMHYFNIHLLDKMTAEQLVKFDKLMATKRKQKAEQK